MTHAGVKLARRAGLNGIRLHDAHHTHATLRLMRPVLDDPARGMVDYSARLCLKRLSDVFEDGLKQLGSTARFVGSGHSMVRFDIPAAGNRW